MIQTRDFHRRPHWQRLAFGLALLPVVVVVAAFDGIRGLLSGLLKLIRDLMANFGQHLVHLYRFYRYDVLSRNPAKYEPKPDPEFWEAQ